MSTNNTAPDGGPNNRATDPVGALADMIRDVEEQVIRVRGIVDDASLPAITANLDALHAAVADMQSEQAELWRAPGQSGPDDDGGRLVQLEMVVDQLGQAVDKLIGDPTPTFPVVCFADLDSDAASKAWRALQDWTRNILFDRYRIGEDEIKPCWYRHKEAVDELSWLHLMWCRAYRTPGAPATAAAEWHDRWLPSVLRRLRGRIKCHGGRHQPEFESNPQPYVDDEEAFRQFVVEDLSRRPPPPQQPAVS